MLPVSHDAGVAAQGRHLPQIGLHIVALREQLVAEQAVDRENGGAAGGHPGRVCRDAVAYALVRNLNGRVKTYKENIYHQMGNYSFIASDTDRANYILGSLNGKPAKQVYKSILHVTDEEILTRTFQNPFGKLNGDDTCIISIKEVQGNALACFRQVNDSDVLILLELGDYQAITRNTMW